MSVNRQLSASTITVGSLSNVLTLPAATDTVCAIAASQSLSNKTLVSVVLGTPASGNLSNCTALPLTSGVSGVLPVANGGTNLASGTSGGVLYYSASGVLASSGALTANQIVIGGGAGAAPSSLAVGAQYVPVVSDGSKPIYLALALDQAAATSGALLVSRGGTGQSSLAAHDVLVGNGTSGIVAVSPSTAGKVLTSNGVSADPSFQTIPVVSPSLNGGSASPQAVTAAGGITLASINYVNFVWVIGDNSGPAPVTVTATPSITAGTQEGQILYVAGTDSTNTVTLQDAAGLTGSGLQLNGTWVGQLYSTLCLYWNASATAWVEFARR